MNENTGRIPETPAPPQALPADDERRVLRVERAALRIDPPMVRFSSRPS